MILETAFELGFTATKVMLVWSLDVSVVLYMKHFSRHFPFRGQLALSLQLQDGVVLLSYFFVRSGSR